MASRRVIASLLDNFLGTFVSRHSEYGGYWLFGFLLDEANEHSVDLLIEPAANFSNSPLEDAVQIARLRFSDQLSKLRVDRRLLRSANLTIQRSQEKVPGQVGGQDYDGYGVTCVAQAVTDFGKIYASKRQFFVVPYDGINARPSGRSTPSMP